MAICVPALIREGKPSDQAVAACINMYSSAKKAKIEYKGYKSPEPGKASEKEKKVLSHTYSNCREKSKDKEKCARIAWSAAKKDGLGVGIGGGALVPQNLAGTAGDEMPLKRKKKITVLGTPVAGVVKQKVAHSLIKQIVEKAFPVGTIRQHKDGVKYKKEAPGKWIPVTDGKPGTAKPAKPEHAAELEREDIAAGDVTFKGMKFEKMANGFMSMKPIEPEAADVLKDAVKDLKGVMYNGANKSYIVPPIHANAILKRTADKYETKVNEAIGKTGQLDLFALDELDKIDDMKKISRTPPPETPVKTPDGKDGKIVDRKLDKEKNPVFTVQTADGKTTEVPEKKIEIKPQTDDKKINELFENASPENRDQVATALNGGKMSEISKEDLIKEIYPSKKTSFVLGQGDEKQTIETDDISGYIVNGLCDDKDLHETSPVDIGIDNNVFLSMACHIPKVKIGADKYLVIIGNKKMIMTGAAVVYNQDKLFRRAKEIAKKKIESHVEQYKKLYPEKTEKEIKDIVKRRIHATAPKILPKGKMATHQWALIKKYHGLKHEIEISRMYKTTENELAYRAADLKSYHEDYESSFQKGRETSYGEKNSSPVLKDKHGVLIKRQNGEALTPDDIEALDDVMQTVNEVYGDQKEKYSTFGLRVSYSGDKRMHARKYSGLFDRRYGTIGISDVRNRHSTAIHEFAHFHDHVNRKTGYSTYASHDPGTAEGEIAEAYRKALPGYGGDVENYWFRSHECFARAIQQYYEAKTFPNYYSNAKRGGNNLLPDYGDYSDYYSEKTRFESDVLPLIEKWLNKNKSVKKSLDRLARARAVWMGGKSTPHFLGDK